MSKLIKIIASILIAVFVLASLALLVPPLLGITTVVSKPALDTNISMGTVVYATRKPITNIYSGDEIIYEDDTSAYLYRVSEVNVADGELYVNNETDKTEGTIRTGSSVYQKRLAIPYIGYILIALESSEGLILLGLGVAFLITLLILGEVIDRRHKSLKEDEEEAESFIDEDSYFQGLAKSVNEPHRLDELNNAPSASAANTAQDAQAPAAPAEPEVDMGATKAVVIGQSAEAAAAAAQNSEEPAQPDAQEPAQPEAAEEPAQSEAEEAAQPEAEEDVQNAAQEEIAAEEKEEPADERAPQEAQESADELAGDDDFESDGSAEAEAPAAAAAVTAAVTSEPEIKEKTEEIKTEAQQPSKKAEPAAAAGTGSIPAVAKAIDADLAGDIDGIPDDEDSAAKHDLNESELPGVEAALEAALATTQVSRSPQVKKPVQQESVPEASEELDEIELAIPVRTLDEYLQIAYTNGDDPQVIKDNTTGISLVDFSDCFKQQ